MALHEKEQPENSAQAKNNKSEDLRVGYNAAVQMVIYDGQLSWQVTGIYLQLAFLLVAGSVFPTFIGSTDQLILSITGLLVSTVGVVMTAMFGSMVMRMRTYEAHWVNCATTLEADLDDNVNTFKGANTLASGGTLTSPSATLQIKTNAGVKSKLILGAFFIGFLVTFSVLAVFNLVRVFLNVL